MGKVDNGRLGLVALAASVLGLAPTACDHAPHADRTAIDLTVTVPADVKVREFAYQVSGKNIKPLGGRVQTPQPQHQFEKLITHVPTGEHFELAVNAKSVDAKRTCTATAPLSVQANAVTRVHAELSCAGGDGTVLISVGLACTTIHLATYTVSPLSASVGGTITLTATPLELDAGTLHYLWTASEGTFDDQTASQTNYRCENVGRMHLNLTVIADHICTENHAIDVDCLDAADASPH